MSTQDIAVVILAAGKGTRMKSDLPKVMHALAGKPMISLLIDQVESLNPDRIIVVTSPEQDALRDLVKPHTSVIQQKQNGTGDAARAALPALEGFDGQVLILLGDEPFTPMNVLAEMAASNEPSVMAIIPPDATGLGRLMVNEEGALDAIVEDKDCSDDQREIYLCNSGNFCVPAAQLSDWLVRIENNNAQSEYYLTDLPQVAKADGVSFGVFTVPIDHVWGVNDRIQLAEHEAIFQDMLRQKFMCDGVSLQDPQTVYFHHDTQIGRDVVIEPGAWFGPNVVIEDGVHIKAYSHFEGATVGQNTSIGPFARLRPGAEIGEDVRIGNFVEVKKSQIGDRSKISHLGYVGDCIMGADTNFGCGAITVNYDGFQKYQTVIGKGVMVGSNANLVAPVSIDDGAFVAAGSTVTEDVPADSLSLERSKSEIRQGWAAKFRKMKAAKKRKKSA